MDSLPCMGLCLLLGTISSPFLTTALLTGDPAKKTPHSSVGSTKVTVYNCRHCGLTVCKLSDFSCCTIIAETQKKTFSNEVIQLETDETHITMCFQQVDTIPEGVYAIIWAKDEGIGGSCGMLKAAASPENREDAVLTEWKTCCTTEIQLAVSSSPLICSSCPRSPDENTSYSASASTSTQSTSAITAIPVVLVICAVAALAVFVLKRQKRKGRCVVHNQIFIDEWEPAVLKAISLAVKSALSGIDEFCCEDACFCLIPIKEAKDYVLRLKYPQWCSRS